tara:strand:+ start:288 stop:392 length:105 start_codon:yes stop_codon:yes gene_type:complete
MTLRVHGGIATAPDVYGALANGQADPREGHIIQI